jgi:GT2 family glycosyltransferase
MESPPRCSIVIPVYGKSHLTYTCVTSVLNQVTPFGVQIIVVDDASPDDTLQMLAGFGDRIEVVRREKNGGYATACNAGLAIARGDYVVFLNNDTESEHQWLATLVAYADAHPKAGVVGCRLLLPNGTIQHAGVAVAGHGLFIHIYYGFPGNAPFVSRSRVMQAVTGAVSLSPRPLLERIGGYDDLYMNNLEDVDMCFAVRDLGYEVHYCADAILTHHESMTRRDGPSTEDETGRRFERKWGGSYQPDMLSLLEQDGLVHGAFGLPGVINLEYSDRWIRVRPKRRAGSSR